MKNLVTYLGVLGMLSLGSGCASQSVHTKEKAVLGGLIGAGAGAVAGHQSGRALEGAAIGAAAGTVAGGLYGNAEDEAESSGSSY